MVDFILFVFCVLLFAVGFWAGFYCGNKYKTIGEMTAAIRAKAKDKL